MANDPEVKHCFEVVKNKFISFMAVYVRFEFSI